MSANPPLGRRCRGWRGALAISAAAGLAAGALAQALPSAGLEPWQPLQFPDIERHTRYERVPSEAGSFLRATSECAASGLVLPVSGVDLAETPRLSWRWRIREASRVDDEREKAGDDFAARVYVLFAYEPQRHSAVERIARRLAGRLYGRAMPGEAICYVWASREPAGDRWTNPFSDRTHVVALRTGSDAAAGGDWQRESVDVMADRKTLLGAPLPPVEAVALMTDSDNGCGRAVADYADFRWLPDASPVREGR